MNTINFNYKIQAKYLEMIAQELGLVLEKKTEKNNLCPYDPTS